MQWVRVYNAFYALISSTLNETDPQNYLAWALFTRQQEKHTRLALYGYGQRPIANFIKISHFIEKLMIHSLAQ